jgi:hypothetical protein
VIAPLQAVVALKRLLVTSHRGRTPAAVGGKRLRQKTARAALGFGVLGFALASLALAAAIEMVKPQWRDPEFGVRLDQIRKWQAKAPHRRPLVVVLGTSRVQMGISPAAMGFPDEPGSPLVYNCGMIGARHAMVLLNLIRLRDAGIKPDAVLIELFPRLLGSEATVESELELWAPRLTNRDLDHVAPFAGDLSNVRRKWAVSRLNPWSQYRLQLMSAWLPTWIKENNREDGARARLDDYGFAPHPAVWVAPREAERARARIKAQQFDKGSRLTRVGSQFDKLIHDLVAWCRAERIEVAFFWTPESPAFRSWFQPEERAVAEEYGRSLTRELGRPVFPAPDHLSEDVFVDGHHLIRSGAEQYSRWLAENHLKPWLARYGLPVTPRSAAGH